jgi:hypothetical protein
MTLQPFVGPWPLFQFLYLFIQTVGLLGRGISPSQGRYLCIGQHKHRTKQIRTQDPSVWVGEDRSCRRPRGHCDRQWMFWCNRMSPSFVGRYKYKHRLVKQKRYGVGRAERQAMAHTRRTQSFHPCPLQPPTSLHPFLWCSQTWRYFTASIYTVACRPVARKRPRNKQLYNSSC